MREKCEWKRDTLYICDKRADEINRNVTTAQEYYPFCKWCGADIRKPEPEVIIKRSGGTWVARFDGDDYLYCGHYFKGPPKFKFEHPAFYRIWTPFNRITITDEIARTLTPAVLVERFGSQSTTIHGIRNGQIVIYDSYNKKYHIEHLESLDRLATVSDLEEK